MDCEENRQSMRVLTRIFLFLLLVILAIYITAFGNSLIEKKGKALAFLPTLKQLPFFKPDQPIETPQLNASQLASLRITDSLANILLASSAHDTIRKRAGRRERRKIDIPPLPEGIPCIPFLYDSIASQKLALFYQKLLAGTARKKQVRIIHFGDSQIEGDRITSYLRSRLQRDFGGQGVGMINPVPSIYPPYGLTIYPSKGWIKESMMPSNQRKKELRYGILGNICSVKEQPEQDETGNRFHGSVTLKRKLKAGRGMQFSQCRILARCDSGALAVTLNIDEFPIKTITIESDSSIHSKNLQIDGEAETFELHFSSSGHFSVYALSLETPTGIQIDNIPLRGSSGTEFTAMDPQTLRELCDALDPSLLVLQFGVNVVPTKQKSYAYYARSLTRQLKYLQQIMPKTPIILMGVSDMGEKEGELFQSYSNLEMVNQAQQKAASDAHIAFWDCRKAMGGHNAIVAWVNATPPLATSDYVHFTPRGARYIGEMFYASLMADYQNYAKGTHRAK